MGTFFKVVLALIGFSVVVNIMGAMVAHQNSIDSNGKAQTAELTPEQTAKLKEALTLPHNESMFVNAVAQGKRAFSSTTDEFRQGATRPARKQAICDQAIARNPVAQDWVGQVSIRTTNQDGKGVFGVSVGTTLSIKTWNNELSDYNSKTLIEPGSPMFEAMGNVQKGDWVRFSGRFFTSDADCIKEVSLGLRGSMTDPEFLFKFDKVEAIPLAN